MRNIIAIPNKIQVVLFWSFLKCSFVPFWPASVESPRASNKLMTCFLLFAFSWILFVFLMGVSITTIVVSPEAFNWMMDSHPTVVTCDRVSSIFELFSQSVFWLVEELSSFIPLQMLCSFSFCDAFGPLLKISGAEIQLKYFYSFSSWSHIHINTYLYFIVIHFNYLT